MKNGFTFIEVLVVLGITVIVAAAVFQISGTLLPRASLDDTRLELTELISRAQRQSMDRVNNASYGVHLESQQFILFQTSYNANDSENEVHAISPSVTLSLSLQGGGADILFNRKGATSSYGSITLTSSQGETRTVTLSQEGKIE
jgi:prepilin-type N-terminal cleavage/methylation domain-containing protein